MATGSVEGTSLSASSGFAQRRLLEETEETVVVVKVSVDNAGAAAAADAVENDPDQFTSLVSAAADAAVTEVNSEASATFETPVVNSIVTPSTSTAPTKSPTPEPTVSMKSRFMMWIWLLRWLGLW